MFEGWVLEHENNVCQANGTNHKGSQKVQTLHTRHQRMQVGRLWNVINSNR